MVAGELGSLLRGVNRHEKEVSRRQMYGIYELHVTAVRHVPGTLEIGK